MNAMTGRMPATTAIIIDSAIQNTIDAFFAAVAAKKGVPFGRRLEQQYEGDGSGSLFVVAHHEGKPICECRLPSGAYSADNLN